MPWPLRWLPLLLCALACVATSSLDVRADEPRPNATPRPLGVGLHLSSADFAPGLHAELGLERTLVDLGVELPQERPTGVDFSARLQAGGRWVPLRWGPLTGGLGLELSSTHHRIDTDLFDEATLLEEGFQPWTHALGLPVYLRLTALRRVSVECELAPLRLELGDDVGRLPPSFGCGGTVWMGKAGGEQAPPAADEATGAPVEESREHLTGRELIFSVGGMGENSPDSAYMQQVAQVEQSYRAAGFRVTRVGPQPRDDGGYGTTAVQRAVASIRAQYDTGDRVLDWVVFHHMGHGWYDHIIYEQTGESPATEGARRLTWRSEAQHTFVFEQVLGIADVARNATAYRPTKFGFVFDACGQGRAVALGGERLFVNSRAGFVATSTPSAAHDACPAVDGVTPSDCAECIEQLGAPGPFSVQFATEMAEPMDWLPDHYESASKAAFDASVEMDSGPLGWETPKGLYTNDPRNHAPATGGHRLP